jgi:hypothetical protein
MLQYYSRISCLLGRVFKRSYVMVGSFVNDHFIAVHPVEMLPTSFSSTRFTYINLGAYFFNGRRLLMDTVA